LKTKIPSQPAPSLLLVDDNEQLRTVLSEVLRGGKFRVTSAANVPEALHLIATRTFDVLLSDLHMPEPGDGFTVISAMRHTNPAAVTLVFTSYPALQESMDAILLQADEILLKSLPASELIARIHGQLKEHARREPTNTERVASILEHDASATIQEWLERVDRESELTCIPLSHDERTGHLPRLLEELVHRLRVPRSLGTKEPSGGAILHGKIRQAQRYTIPMIIEESRILQVSIFHTLQKNLTRVDFSLLLNDVMTIADEVDSQLKQTIISFTTQQETKEAGKESAA
jgi:DNA-binding response OmpR family regulator